ncbi:DMT family transporter [Mobilitalea sibirica]|uniref:DMT family transporter n=1 Tax=Mobilitalea sibirica TaxID=1462919 RepID=A0A8J7GXX9_9FIRM|nr:DMT family transporter [Mobilitalea sibirica]MBH1940194.1 DMT family transporter [Mobilitalea sibirica]
MKSKLYLIITMLLFGSIGLFVKNISLPSSQIALVRGVVGSLFLLMVALLTKKKLSIHSIKNNLLLLLAAGAAIGFNWIFLFEAYRYTTISNATLSYYFAPVFVAFMAPFILKEKMNKTKILCVLVAMIGMFFIVEINKTSGFHKDQLLGIGYGLLAAILYASVILMNKFVKNISGLETTIIQLSMASVVLLPYIIITNPINLSDIPGKSMILLVTVGLLHTGLAYLLYFVAIRNLKAQTIASLSYIDPISAIIMSGIILGEVMSWQQMLGGVLILGATFYSELSGISVSKKSRIS